jgi:hypothetical protein
MPISSSLSWRPHSHEVPRHPSEDPSGAHSPFRVVEQLPDGASAGSTASWTASMSADLRQSLYSYAHSLLHFVRWWESVHHTGDISEADLTESTLLDYVRFQSSLNRRRLPPPSTTASLVPIAPSATSSPMLPVRPRPASIRFTCIAGRWASAGPGSISADCA